MPRAAPTRVEARAEAYNITFDSTDHRPRPLGSVDARGSTWPCADDLAVDLREPFDPWAGAIITPAAPRSVTRAASALIGASAGWKTPPTTGARAATTRRHPADERDRPQTYGVRTRPVPAAWKTPLSTTTAPLTITYGMPAG